MKALGEHSAAPTAALQSALARRHMPVLDGLRAVSVFTVMAYHFGASAVPGDLGVSAFFVLSGFLITRLLLAEHEAAGRISLQRFYLRRVLRIFPAYYAFLAVSFAIDRARGGAWPPGLLRAAIVYGVNYYNALRGMPSTSIEHAWSLAVEEQFYLLWPVTLMLLLRRGNAFAARATVAIVLAVAVWRSVLYLWVGVPHAYVYNAFDTRLDVLAVGCLLALCIDQRAVQRSAELLAGNVLAPVVTLALLLISRRAVSADYHYSVGFTVNAVLIAVLMVQLLALHPRSPWRWLDHPVARYLGTISYPLYLWHVWGWGVARRFGSWPIAAQWLVGVAVCVAVASFSYYVVERPFLRLKDRLGSPRARQPGLDRAASAAEVVVTRIA